MLKNYSYFTRLYISNELSNKRLLQGKEDKIDSYNTQHSVQFTYPQKVVRVEQVA